MMYHRRILLALLILLLGPVQACNKGAGDGPNSQEGALRVLTGTCTVTEDGKATTLKADQRMTIKAGAVLETSSDGNATVAWGKANNQILHASTKLTFVATAPEYGATKVSLAEGICEFLLPKAEKESQFKFQASARTIVAAVKGTVFQLSASDKTGVQVDALRGTTYVFNPASGDPVDAQAAAGNPIAVGAGTTWKQSADGAVSTVPLSTNDVERMTMMQEGVTGNPILTY